MTHTIPNQTNYTPATPAPNYTPADYIHGYQDAVHNTINIHAYDTCKEYQKGFDAGCMDMRLGEALYGEEEVF